MFGLESRPYCCAAKSKMNDAGAWQHSQHLDAYCGCCALKGTRIRAQWSTAKASLLAIWRLSMKDPCLLTVSSGGIQKVILLRTIDRDDTKLTSM